LPEGREHWFLRSPGRWSRRTTWCSTASKPPGTIPGPIWYTPPASGSASGVSWRPYSTRRCCCTSSAELSEAGQQTSDRLARLARPSQPRLPPV